MPGRKPGLTRSPAHPPSDPRSAARGDFRRGCGYGEPFSGRAGTRFRGKARALTCTNFMATSRNPFCSNLLMISPTSPRWTPSGLIAMKVRSPFPAMALRAGMRREGTRSLKVGGGHGGTAPECRPGPTEHVPALRNPARPLRPHLPWPWSARPGPARPYLSGAAAAATACAAAAGGKGSRGGGRAAAPPPRAEEEPPGRLRFGGGIASVKRDRAAPVKMRGTREDSGRCRAQRPRGGSWPGPAAPVASATSRVSNLRTQQLKRRRMFNKTKFLLSFCWVGCFQVSPRPEGWSCQPGCTTLHGYGSSKAYLSQKSNVGAITQEHFLVILLGRWSCQVPKPHNPWMRVTTWSRECVVTFYDVYYLALS